LNLSLVAGVVLLLLAALKVVVFQRPNIGPELMALNVVGFGCGGVLRGICQGGQGTDQVRLQTANFEVGLAGNNF